MYRSLPAALGAFSLFAFGLQALAQQTVHQVLVLNEGYLDFGSGEQVVPVTLGSYDPATGLYTTVATIADARFGTHVAVHDGSIYVAADSFLLKYDADTYTLLDQAVITGIRAFSFWNDQLVVTRGEVGLDNYVQVRDAATLDLVYAVPSIDVPYSCEDVEVVGDMAYIAVNNAFDWANTVGMVGLLDLATASYQGGIDLGPEGKNPENIMVRGEELFTLNNRDFSASSISKIGTTSNTLDYTSTVTAGGGCMASEIVSNDRIYFLEYDREQMARFDVTTDVVSDTLSGSIAPYALLEDPLNGVIYATTTDFFSSGELHVLAYDGTVMSTVPVSVSPGALALDVRTGTGVADGDAAAAMALYPNPTTHELFVRTPAALQVTITITDAAGRAVLRVPAAFGTTQRVDVSGLAPGAYALQAGDATPLRFVKR